MGKENDNYKITDTDDTDLNQKTHYTLFKIHFLFIRRMPNGGKRSEVIEPIIEPMDQSIFQKSYEVGENLLELDFDELSKSDIIEVIPILRAINKISKGVLKVRDRFFIKKIILFINQYNSGMNTEEIQKFVSNILTDGKFRKKVNEKILILLDRFDDEFKALILAELLKSWIRFEIDWNTFQRLTYSVEKAHPSVFIFLYDYYINMITPNPPLNLGGAMFRKYQPIFVQSGFGNITENRSLYPWGSDVIDIIEYGLKNLLNDKYEVLSDDIINRLRDPHGISPNSLIKMPFLSDFEEWLIGVKTVCPNFKTRKEINQKIRKYYSF